MGTKKPLVSVITPSQERPFFLQRLYTLLKQQDYVDWQWLIYDTSIHPSSFSDNRINYIYSPHPLSIGEKRNRLIGESKGEIILHCDDDDYYAPGYLETVVKEIEEVDFFNIHSWFSYDLKTNQFYYWDTDQPGETHFVLDAMTGMRVREVDFGEHMDKARTSLMENGKKGYGFTYAYRKEIAQHCNFKEVDIGEDRRFYASVERKGFKIKSLPDRKGIALNIVHHWNTARVYPQFRIPHFLIEQHCPHFLTYIKTLPTHEDRPFSM